MNKVVSNIIVPLETSIDEVYKIAIKKSKIKSNDIKCFIKKRSIDARRNNVRYVYSVGINYGKDEFKKEEFEFGTKKLASRPIIIGCGPAGFSCAYFLAKNGYAPILFERGESVDNREKSVQKFYDTKILNTNSNLQFGEGGAGTFSDGKLNTRVNDKRYDDVINMFVKNGANEDISYDAKPHIGTDVLKNVVKNIRNEIILNGGEVHFESTLTNIKTVNGKIKSIFINNEEIHCEVLILALGHSARDTYKMLYANSIEMQAKPFAIGLRIEHLREFIDKNQYGDFAGNKILGAADYRLTYNGIDRSCFSFCMCPGGFVMGAQSEENMNVVNGMSNYKRDGINSNSAIVCQVRPDDFPNGVLGGIEFQRHYEKLAYNLTGSFVAPVSLTKDFIEDRTSLKIENVKPTYPLGYEFANLNKCLPKYVSETLNDGFRYFDRKINGFIENSILTGVETRTSAPLRINRNENMECVNCNGIYPIGEGAGYAGGIMSAAIDGIKAAEAIMKKFTML